MKAFFTLIFFASSLISSAHAAAARPSQPCLNAIRAALNAEYPASADADHELIFSGNDQDSVVAIFDLREMETEYKYWVTTERQGSKCAVVDLNDCGP